MQDEFWRKYDNSHRNRYLFHLSNRVVMSATDLNSLIRLKEHSIDIMDEHFEQYSEIVFRKRAPLYNWQ